MRLAVLASGRGSNLLAILDAIAHGVLDAQVVGAFSDKAEAPALARARAAGVPAQSASPRGFASRGAFDEHLFSLVDAVQPDLIVCAGYMRLISDAAVAARTGRMINIHPSLLPAFKGLRTHQQALDAGVRVHGASVHFVTAELDGGPVIAQARIPVEAGDDAAALAERVLQREHPLLIATLRELAAGRVALVDARVHFNGHALAAPLQLDAGNRLTQESAA
ncbi:phosphoribosylglycinamide formyltransferase [Lysobacter solisilvae (ex Woo and Kim 2020)]|uniref:Phosphoribosylglycinamide formyltransferase n=1 Tax=Agrilutibacter terrestris TaxID=2865112 RepID=A0A7H0FYQ1_9GAMM|nr:phosphoribosylglycinamide formyltransferase [Lysobacter terrestris]QNP41167.1 phosphoribosylglycinamide formyltransferase [Lysobacter terrestris]